MTVAGPAVSGSVGGQAASTGAARPHPVLRLAGYLIWCFIAVGLAQIAAILVAGLGRFTNAAVFVYAIFGEQGFDVALKVIGNLTFAIAFGYLVGEGVTWLLERIGEPAKLVAAVSAGVLALAFPVISVGLLWTAHEIAPRLAEEIVSQDAYRIIATVCAYGLVCGLAALGLAVLVEHPPHGTRRER